MNFTTPLINWLCQNDIISANPLFLNASKSQDNAIQIVTEQISKQDDIEYIDGSILHKITFTLFDYQSISFNQLVKTMIDKNENVADLLTLGNIAEWVREQDKNGNYPDFGSEYEVQKIYPVYLSPSTPSIDNGMAKYSVPIVCEVLECQKNSYPSI